MMRLILSPMAFQKKPVTVMRTWTEKMMTLILMVLCPVVKQRLKPIVLILMKKPKSGRLIR